MAIQILTLETAAISPQEGDIVAVDRDGNGKYHTGLVTHKTGDDKLAITYWDGKDGTVFVHDQPLVLKINEPLKKPLAFKDVRNLLLKERVEKKKAIHPGLAPLDPKEALQIQDERRLDMGNIPKVSIPDNLKKAYLHIGDHNAANRAKQLWFMEHLWKHLNTTKFQGEMKVPNIGFMKLQGVMSMRVRAYWRGGSYRNLNVSPRLFNSQLGTFVEIFLHEMAHQAVSEISKVNEMRINKGHGPVWKGWMVKVGLDPNQFDHRMNDVFQSTEEKSKDDEIVRLGESLSKSQICAYGIGPNSPYPGRIIVSKEGKIQPGIVICCTEKPGEFIVAWEDQIAVKGYSTVSYKKMAGVMDPKDDVVQAFIPKFIRMFVAYALSNTGKRIGLRTLSRGFRVGANDKFSTETLDKVADQILAKDPEFNVGPLR